MPFPFLLFRARDVVASGLAAGMFISGACRCRSCTVYLDLSKTNIHKYQRNFIQRSLRSMSVLTFYFSKDDYNTAVVTLIPSVESRDKPQAL